MSKELDLDRFYDATPDRVFDAWVDVDLLTQWWGCAPDMLWNVHTWEPEVGGQIHVSLDFDGTPFEVRGEFLVVDRPSHLRYTWDNSQIVDVRIEAEGEGARLRLNHSNLPDEQLPIVNGGWSHAIGLLAERLTIAAPTS